MSGLGIKAAILIGLCAQNTAYSLMIRYSRGILKEDYSVSGMVIVIELTKLVIALAMMTKDPEKSQVSLLHRCQQLTKNSMLMAVPAFLYFVQKILAFYCLQNMDPALYAILIQSKLLTTAVFSVVLLRRQLSYRKWRALALLFCGIVLTKLATGNANLEDAAVSFGPLIAVACVAMTSGFSGTYIELVLKKDANHMANAAKLDIWERNYQLSLWGALFALLSAFYFDSEIMARGGILSGFSIFSWMVVVVAAVGGILVALVAKYADMIIKGFATGAALVLTALMNIVLFDGVLTMQGALAMVVVIISIFNYNEPEEVPQKVVTVRGLEAGLENKDSQH